MATEVKVIKVRRGSYTDFDKTKMNAGEPAVTTSGDPNAIDGKGVYMGVGPGQVKQVAMIEDIEDILNNALDGAVDEATQQAEAEADRAEAAATQLASTVQQVGKNTTDITELNERLGTEIATLSNLLNDAFRHYLEVVLRAGLYSEDVSDTIGVVISAMEGTDGTALNDDVLTISYSLADPAQDDAVLVFS